MIKIFPIILLLLLPSCTGSITYISYGKSLADLVSFIMTDKTTTEHGMDLITGQDCKFIYVLKEKNLKEVCKKNDASEDLKKPNIWVGDSYLNGLDTFKL